MEGKRKIVVAAGMLFLLFLTGCREEEKVVLAPPQVEKAADENADNTDADLTEEGANAEAVPGEQEEVQNQDEIQIDVYLNGNRLELENGAYAVDGKIMVPLEAICEFFSRKLECTLDGERLTIDDAKFENTIILTAGESNALVNGRETTLETEPVMAGNGVLMVEVSAFLTLLDAEYKYQEEIQSVYITESGLC